MLRGTFMELPLSPGVEGRSLSTIIANGAYRACMPQAYMIQAKQTQYRIVRETQSDRYCSCIQITNRRGILCITSILRWP